MSEFERYLRWISRVQVACSVGGVASLVVGVMSIMGNFGPVWSIVWGVLSAVVLVVSIVGLHAMSWRVFEVEEGFHRRNYELTTTLLEKKPSATLLEGRPW